MFEFHRICGRIAEQFIPPTDKGHVLPSLHVMGFTQSINVNTPSSTTQYPQLEGYFRLMLVP